MSLPRAYCNRCSFQSQAGARGDPKSADLRTRIQTALRLVWQTAPRWTLVNVALVFWQGALPLAALYLMKRIVDTVTASITRLS